MTCDNDQGVPASIKMSFQNSISALQNPGAIGEDGNPADDNGCDVSAAFGILIGDVLIGHGPIADFSIEGFFEPLGDVLSFDFRKRKDVGPASVIHCR